MNQGFMYSYAGICYDIQQGDAGLLSLFQSSFAAAKAKGLKVMVTVGGTQPSGISDGSTLMTAFLASANIDIISPRLYTLGTEGANSYAVASGAIPWANFKTATALIAPAMVSKCYYADAVTYFAGQGVTISGYIQWTQNAVTC